MNIKAKIFGYRGQFNAADRIEQELVRRGISVSDSLPDFLYHTNGLYYDSEAFYQSCLSFKKPKRIYNLLDIDEGKSFSFYKDVEDHLNGADVICSISEVVASQMRSKFKLNKTITILPYPIRPVSYYNIPWGDRRGVEYLFVGRCYSANKRFFLVHETLAKLGALQSLVIVGGEIPSCGNFAGNLNDADLEKCYNNAHFLFLPSSFEGLGLTCIEAAICGAFPVLCDDNKVVYELGMQEFAAKPAPKYLAEKILDMKDRPEYYSGILDNLRDDFIKKYSLKGVVDKLLSLYKTTLN